MYSTLLICGPGLISGKELPVTQSSPSPSSVWLYFLCELNEKRFLTQYLDTGLLISTVWSVYLGRTFDLQYFFLIVNAYQLELCKDYQKTKPACQLILAWRIRLLDSDVYMYKSSFGRKGTFIGKFLGKDFDCSLRTF